MGLIWIQYGWAADDPVGIQHAIARSILSYARFLFAPESYKATAISAAVLLCCKSLQPRLTYLLTASRYLLRSSGVFLGSFSSGKV
jgi:hypothetical protein